jgi:carbon storage regulator
MLVLTRRVSDQILVPALGITVEVLSIKGNVVKLGIQAPQEVRVLRGELAGTPPKSCQTTSLPLPTQSPGETSGKVKPVPNHELSQTSPLGGYLRKCNPPSSKKIAARTVTTKPVLFTSDDSAESVCETRSAYEVCI